MTTKEAGPAHMEARKKRGQPLKLTPKVIERLVRGYRLGMTQELAAQYAGVSSSSLARWLRRRRDGEGGIFGDLLEAIERAEAEGAAVMLARVQKHAEDNWNAAAWLLERRHGYRRNERVQIDQKVEGSMVVDVQVQALTMEMKALDIEQLKALAWSEPNGLIDADDE